MADSASKSTKKYTAPMGELSWSEDGRSVVIDGVTLVLAHPDTTENNWIGQEEILRQNRIEATRFDQVEGDLEVL